MDQRVKRRRMIRRLGNEYGHLRKKRFVRGRWALGALIVALLLVTWLH